MSAPAPSLMLAIRLSERNNVTAATVHTADHLARVREQLASDDLPRLPGLREGVRGAAALVLPGRDRA